ncbi:OmpA family protein [Fulvivirgaceae bacterium PWU4]|uniref:OmpA family protein n=1 Tax=Chryseosolibacter histidini TaxID=2782349 RepID=A0AAP2DRK9_9BACT|nr:OmpA family protein [Chryseosolibacter histidini]MBT1701266.1 OmpA family protein [Chryseosolibacter histidini]
MTRLTLIFLLFTTVVRAQLPVIVHESFDVNTYGWLEHETATHKVMFQNGKYFMEAPSNGWMSCVAPYVDDKKDFSFEATFTQVDGENDNGYGFVWGHDGKNYMNTFTITANGFFRILCPEPSLGINDNWREADNVRPMGQPNKLKVEQRKNMLYFYLNGKQVATTKSFPWHGKYLGFVAYTKMKLEIDDFILSHDIDIILPIRVEPPGNKENLGPNVNSKYDEVSPKISADGKTLYFGRKFSPENVGGAHDKEDIWESRTTDGRTWSKSLNLGAPVNTPATNNLIAASTDNNTLLFHVNEGFAFMHRTATGWSALEDQGIRFKNESPYLEGCLSPDGKAIVFVAKFKANAFYRSGNPERDIYVCLKQADGTWSPPIHTGKVLNSPGDEYSPFLSADGRTLYFASNGRPGYGDADIYMSKRMTDDWKQWSEPVNLGLGINTAGFDAYYTLPASGDFGYMVSNTNTIGLADIIRFRLPQTVRPDPVVLVSGRVLNAKTQKPLAAMIKFDDLNTGREVGEARVNPRTGEYKIALPAGKNYGYHAAAAGYLSVSENLELIDLQEYNELKKDLLLVPIEIGESIQLKNVFFVQSKWELRPESYPELDRLVKIMKDNPTIEIELSGHTDNRGVPSANLELSERRVEAVRQYLINKGVPPRRMTGRGYGGAKPIAPSTTEENRQMNRRVEFKIVKK